MKFVAFTADRLEQDIGILSGDGAFVLPLSSLRWPEVTDLVSVIERWPELEPMLARTDMAAMRRLDEVTLEAPVPRPRRNVFCIGKNYVEHAEEFGASGYDTGGDRSPPEAPIFFTKAPSSVIGHGAEINPHPSVTSELDYEAELGVIIGRGGMGISRGDAMKHVWGYTIINDVTARDLQKRHRQWFLGKSLDTFCPMGPWAVTADEVGVEPLELVCKVNGEERQRASTKDLIFDIPAIIATLSAGITLQPGDIIATGTPKGVGVGFDPPKFLRPGDVVEISITRLGTLRNVVGQGQR